MAPETKIAARRLGLRLFLDKIRLLMHFGIHTRSQNVVRSIAELESFLSIPNSSIFGLLSEKFKEKEVNYTSAIDSVLENIDNCTWIGF